MMEPKKSESNLYQKTERQIRNFSDFSQNEMEETGLFSRGQRVQKNSSNERRINYFLEPYSIQEDTSRYLRRVPKK
jgi:hypothetical protein